MEVMDELYIYSRPPLLTMNVPRHMNRAALEIRFHSDQAILFDTLHKFKSGYPVRQPLHGRNTFLISALTVVDFTGLYDPQLACEYVLWLPG